MNMFEHSQELQMCKMFFCMCPGLCPLPLHRQLKKDPVSLWGPHQRSAHSSYPLKWSSPDCKYCALKNKERLPPAAQIDE